MHKITLVLACLACVGHGQQGQPSVEQQVDRQQPDKQERETRTQTSLGSLAMLLMTTRPLNLRGTVRYPVGRAAPVMTSTLTSSNVDDVKIPEVGTLSHAQRLRSKADEAALKARKAELELEKIQLEIQLMKQQREVQQQKESAKADKDHSGLIDGQRPTWPQDNIGQFHRFVERTEKTSDKVTGYQYKTRETFIPSKREGSYQGTYRVSFAVPGDEGGETIELLQTSMGKPHFGALRVKMTDLVLSVTELAEFPLSEEIIRGEQPERLQMPEAAMKDPWENVAKTDGTVSMAAEVFAKFDEDHDGYWNHQETSRAQMATEGSEMTEEAYNALVFAVAPNGGKDVTEKDLRLGLSKDKVVELYTDVELQRKLGCVLDVRKDHAKINNKAETEGLIDQLGVWRDHAKDAIDQLSHKAETKSEAEKQKEQSIFQGAMDAIDQLKNGKSEAEIENKDFPTQLVVSEVAPDDQDNWDLWEKINLKEGDIIRAMSIPDRKKEHQPWWDVGKKTWKAVMGDLPEADEGMIFFERHSIEDFYKTLQENLRVGGFDAEAVLLVERPEFPKTNDNGNGFRVRTKAF